MELECTSLRKDDQEEEDPLAVAFTPSEKRGSEDSRVRTDSIARLSRLHRSLMQCFYATAHS